MRSNIGMKLAVGAMVLSPLYVAATATAQDWQARWDAVVAEAQGTTLNIVVQPDEAFGRVVNVFQERFPGIRVVYTNANPSAFAPRLITEQQNGLFAWDVWWSSASNMTIVAIPANALEEIPPYLILPEVADESYWQDPDFIYTSDVGPYVFVHTHYLQNLGYYNTDLVPGGVLEDLDAMLDPALRGMIALRSPNRPHGGSQMLAQALKMAGEEWLVSLFTDMQPIIVDNARQVTDGVIRGDYAIGIGTDASALYACIEAGGCQNVEKVPFSYLHSRAVSIPRNPPNPAGATVFVNWLLSQEGQETYVREWAIDNQEGAYSMRRDVEPDPNHLDSLPDFSALDQYVAVSLESGVEWINRVGELFDASRSN